MTHMASPGKGPAKSSPQKPQRSALNDSSEDSSTNVCEITAVGKRRDGGTRFWCVRHHGDATAKYGRPAKTCRNTKHRPIDPKKVLTLDLDKYAGGIALWGAAPAIYDTTILPLERGIHVHARPKIGAGKEIDNSYAAVRIVGATVPNGEIVISEAEAVHFMTGSVFGVKMRYIACSNCGHPHLDADWFSTHAHRTHLCGWCGHYFKDRNASVGNPVCGIREACSIKAPRLKTLPEKLAIKQADYPGGIQIWGSSPALLWTSPVPESKGIHVHAFKTSGEAPEIDETFSSVTIDGMKLDPQMVRVLMAQRTLSSLRPRIVTINCPKCTAGTFGEGPLAFTPLAIHECSKCGSHFSAKGRIRKTIGNPLLGILPLLAKNAPRPPQHHELVLFP